jgi:hypothetical protein
MIVWHYEPREPWGPKPPDHTSVDWMLAIPPDDDDELAFLYGLTHLVVRCEPCTAETAGVVFHNLPGISAGDV